MTLIHTHIPKRKKRKPTAKQRDLQASWEQLMKKYEPKKPVAAKPYREPSAYRRETANYPSVDTGVTGAVTTAKTPQYTGNAMMGIATLHKSNAVPVFTQEDAIEISRMRRG